MRSLGAVQAQDYRQALWAVGLRMRQATVGDVEKALQEGKLMRTWVMRGTLHIILPEDAKWMLKLLATRVMARLTPKIWQYHGTDAEMMALAERTFTKALSGGKVLTRSAMIDLLKKVGIPNDKQQSYFMFGYLCQTGVLCVGPPQANEQTFVLLDEWAPDQRQLTYDESLAVIAKRFFGSHGPATISDFANWSGIKVSEAKMGLEFVKCDLIKETVGNREYWLPPDSASRDGIFLLPGYDEFLIGYKDRGPSFEKYGVMPISTYNGMFFPTIVVDGQVAGLWKRTIKKTRIDIEVRPVSPIDVAKIESHAAQLGAFFGLPVKITKREP